MSKIESVLKTEKNPMKTEDLLNRNSFMKTEEFKDKLTRIARASKTKD
jgi:hypothetical protein